MRIVYTHHARRRMTQRKISEAEVVETLENPNEILPGDGPEDTAVKQSETHEVMVVYEETEEETVVIYTVMRRKRLA